MKVFKFGGASVRDASGIRNLTEIVSREKGDVVVVVSAMGKTTNALERVVEAIYQHDAVKAQAEWEEIRTYHEQVAAELGIGDRLEMKNPTEQNGIDKIDDYDILYDQVVSNGELWSTKIVANYLQSQGMAAHWVDMTEVMVTDMRYREANVYFDATRQRLNDAVKGKQIAVVQGFIGGAPNGTRTTLGREGSDYTAAIVANLLDAESVIIWKDVPGILNADPRLIEETVLIPELTYADAVELAYSGAQVIHPKTLRPLENKKIPLYVKPFGNPDAAGSIIHEKTKAPISVPVYIWRKNQILLTMRAKDLGFLLEDGLSDIFETMRRNRLKVSLIQSSAVTISVAVDETRYTEKAIAELSERYKVSWNSGLSLLTIRGTTPEIIKKETEGRDILLSQRTRRTIKLLVR